MKKGLFIFALGLLGGYNLGWSDAQKNAKTAFTRVVERIGGSTRDKYQTDIDGTMERLEKR